MQLLRLEVRNWVHHRYRVCEFTRGLVAILGENGSGKSSLFGAIRWLLTGENPNYGVKTDNISQYAKEGEPSYATLEFEHAGHIAVVTRHLLPEKEQSVLTIDGTEVARGDKAVTAAIEKLLGVDAKFISRFIIVGQTDIFSFIDDSQSETDKFFQRLFNTAKADKCQDAIGKNLAKISIPELAVTSAELATQREKAQQVVDDFDSRLAKLPTSDAFFKLLADDQAIVQAWDEREKAVADMSAAAGRAVAARADLKRTQDEYAQHAADLRALDVASAGQEEAIAAARTALGHWQSYKNVAKSREKLQATLAEVARLRAKDPEPEKPGALSSDELRRDLASKDALLKEIKAFIDMFDTQGVAECPTCRTPSSQLTEQVAKHRAELESVRAIAAELREAALKQSALEHAHKLWQNRERDRAEAEQKACAAEQQLQEMPAPELSEEELAQTVTDYDAFQKARNEILPVADAARLKCAQLEGAIANTEELIDRLKEKIDAAKVSAADAELAKRQIAELSKKLAERTELEKQRAEAKYQLKLVEDRHAQALADEEKARKLRAWVSTAERTRDALKNAPRLVAQRNLQKLEVSINDLLQVFGVNFQVKVAEDGSPTFIAEFYDGRRQVAQRLSIGQKTVLAIAFRVAVNAMYAEEIGLLALDEPTASLDAPRIRSLAPVLEKLRELSTAKGLQCLLVTHAASLSNLFESAIELEPPELRHGNAT